MRGVPDADTDAVLLAGVAVGTVAALALVFLGGFVRTGPLTVLLHLIAVALPVVGLVIVLLVLRYGLDTYSRSIGGFGGVSTGGFPSRYASIDEEMASRLTRAANSQYRPRSGSAASEVHTVLRTGAVRTLKTHYGLSHDQALEALEAGAWTDDPVAAAFLSGTGTYPLSHRLRVFLDPGRAYRYRVRRTMDAIDAVDSGNGPARPDIDASLEGEDVDASLDGEDVRLDASTTSGETDQPALEVDR